MAAAMISRTDDSVWRRLRRSDGRGPLRVASALVCADCEQSFPIEAGIARLIGRRSAVEHSEVATQDHVADHYDGVRYERPSSLKYPEDTMAQLVKLAPPRGVVLDDGCGTGAFPDFARLRAVNVERYIGIDVSRGRLTHAQRRLKLAGDNHLLVQGDACQLPFAENSFDVVHARPLLHHPSEPQSGVRELQRVLKPGGVDQMWFFGYLAYPLLGLPDLVDFDKLGISRLADGLIHVDHALARLPLLRRLGWGVMMSALN